METIAEACKQNAADLTSQIEDKVDALTRAFEESPGSAGVGRMEGTHSNTRKNAPQQFFPLLATNDGPMSRLPANFQFPKSTDYDF
jgi:DNA polymerase II small subunit/DNA polymerase delta subunit B